MTTHVQRRTRMFARVMGPYLTIVAIVVAFRAPDMRQLLAEFTAGNVWPWVMGAIVLITGIAIVAFHQYWRGGAAIIISALGWLLVVRGIFLLAFPAVFASLADRAIAATWSWVAVYVVMALIGLYLTYTGWRPDRNRLQSTDIHIEIERPRAA
ncbi:hypothetical protein DVS77_12490 [Mycolicibacterium moriokaense]|nr:hypothetical protein DVS77_12490 [Mycolicibacterium moriokaense]